MGWRTHESVPVAQDKRTAGPYQVFMLGLCVYVLVELAVLATFDLSPDTLKILDVADTLICVFFLADFFRNMAMAPNRVRYFFTWGWLDLLSSIPALDVFRWGRATRVFRILRVLRGIRAARLLGQFAIERRSVSAFWSALLIAVLVTIFGSIGILHLETSPESTILDADDALWWAFVTVTTVGYGDEVPVTPSGRLLAAAVMITGIGLFGTFTAYLASLFLAPEEAETEREIEGLRRDIAELRGLILEMHGRSEVPGKRDRPA